MTHTKAREFWIQLGTPDFISESEYEMKDFIEDNSLRSEVPYYHVREVIDPDPRDEALREAKEIIKFAGGFKDTSVALPDMCEDWLDKYKDLT